MEYYGLRPAGADIDFVVTREDYEGLADLYPAYLRNLWGDLGVCVFEFEIWKSICLSDYAFLSQGAIDRGTYLVISLDRLLFLKALAMHIEKYHKDLELIVAKVNQQNYAHFVPIYELERVDFHKIRQLVEPLKHHLAVESILNGSTPARIFIDDPSRPQSAFIWSRHRFFLAGSAQNGAFNQSVRKLYDEVIYPQAIANREVIFVLYYAPSDWDDVIPEILKDKKPIQAMRQYYRFDTKNLQPGWREALPVDFELHPVDEVLLGKDHLKNLDDLREEMCSERPSVQDFLKQSFGVSLLRGDEIAGWCLSEYNCKEGCEVGIETRLPYRERGLGTLMTRALAEQAYLRGIAQVGWHCWKNNVPSVRTGLKAGFELVCDYPAYYAFYKPEDGST